MVAGIGLTGVAGLLWSYRETSQYTLRTHTVPVLPAGSRDLRILHISDLHLTPTQTKKIAWVRDLAELQPDFVINTGDNMAHLQVLPALRHALEPLLKIPGAFAMGSNDYYAPAPRNPLNYLLPHKPAQSEQKPPELPWQELALTMTGAGWHDMTNTRAKQRIGDFNLELVGVDDAHLELDDYPTPVPRTPDTTLRIGIMHAPYTRVLNAMVADDCDLLIAGHTHGGQVCLPGYGALVTNCDLDQRRAQGLHGWPGQRPDEFGGQDSAWLHVSAGLGTSPYAPVRFACRPEATLLTLTAH